MFYPHHWFWQIQTDHTRYLVELVECLAVWGYILGRVLGEDQGQGGELGGDVEEGCLAWMGEMVMGWTEYKHYEDDLLDEDDQEN